MEGLWEEWQLLHERAKALCSWWQQIETQFVRAIGFPRVVIPSSDRSNCICAQSHAEIDKALAANGNVDERKRAALHAELAAHRTQWDAEAARLGFDEAKQKEDEAWRREAQTSEAIFRARATSLMGIEIKIALMVQLCSAGSDDPDFPLPQLRSTLADVKRLRRAADAVQV
jgi:hypothetical protein